jgi:hypothetical protein
VFIRIRSHRALHNVQSLLRRKPKEFWRHLNEDHWFQVTEAEWALIQERATYWRSSVSKPVRQPDPDDLSPCGGM